MNEGMLDLDLWGVFLISIFVRCCFVRGYSGHERSYMISTKGDRLIPYTLLYVPPIPTPGINRP